MTTDMNQLIKEAMECYRERGYDEIEMRQGNTVVFVDEFEDYYPVNNISVLEPTDYVSDDFGFEDWVNLDRLNEILKALDPLLFLPIHQIHVLKTPADIEALETYLERPINQTYLGFWIPGTNDIVINLVQIMKTARKQADDAHDFFRIVTDQFYLTLIHELGHASLRENGLDENFRPLIENEEQWNEFLAGELDEEELVENYASKVFNVLDEDYYVFLPFNKALIMAQY